MIEGKYSVVLCRNKNFWGVGNKEAVKVERLVHSGLSLIFNDIC